MSLNPNRISVADNVFPCRFLSLLAVVSGKSPFPILLLAIALLATAHTSVSAASPTPLFFDDFERTDVGGQWQMFDYPGAVNGPSAWGIRQGALFQDSNIYLDADYSGTLAVAGSASWTNYTVMARVKPTDNDAWGILARYQSSSNYLRFLTVQDPGNGGPFSRLEKCVNGTNTTLAEITSRTYVVNAYQQARVDVYGSQIDVWLNADKILTAKDASLASGKVGICTWASSCEVEDVSVLSEPPLAPAPVTQQWDFDSGNLRATAGIDLEFASDAVRLQTRFGSTRDFGLPDIGNQPAQVMEVPALNPMKGYAMRTANFANGGGGFINQYTLICDLFYPTSTDGQWRVILQTDPENTSDGDVFVNPSGGMGISGHYEGKVTVGAWHRLAVAVDLTVPVMAKFIDGAKVGEQNPGGLDGRFALNSMLERLNYALLFADNDGENALGYVNSVQFRPERVSDADILALGGPSASGIPLDSHNPPAATNLTITVQPENQTVNVDSNATFSVQARGPDPLHYQWFKDGVLLVDATNAVLALNHARVSDAGSYSVTVSVPGLTTNSQPARLTVVSAGSDDSWVALGRGSLANTNLAKAQEEFASALAVNPQHPEANVFLVLTRLASLLQDPESGAFLDRLNISRQGRNPFNWTASLALGTNGFPILPDGLRSTELSAFALNHLLPTLLESSANLDRVTDTNALIKLDPKELSLFVGFKGLLTSLLPAGDPLFETVAPLLDRMTTNGPVELDFADLSFLKGLFSGVQMFAAVSQIINIDLDLSTLPGYYNEARALNLERLLKDYPRLLTLASTNDLPKARDAFGQFATLYPLALEQIDQRPTNRVALFKKTEDSLITGLLVAFLPTLKTSLEKPVALLSTNMTVYLGKLFSGTVSPRLLLPRFQGANLALGTFPDLTFGGILQGIPLDMIEDLLSLRIQSAPNILRATLLDNRAMRLTIRASKEHGYAVEGSSDLKRWTSWPIFLAATNQLEYSFQPAAVVSPYFARLKDYGTNLPPPLNDNFSARIVLTGSPVSVVGYNFNATREPGEPATDAYGYGAGKSVWYSWTAEKSGSVTLTAVAVKNLQPLMGVFTGTALNQLTRIASGWEDVSFNATAGATYQILIDGEASDPVGGFQLSIAL